jgi:hypothetical protein
LYLTQFLTDSLDPGCVLKQLNVATNTVLNNLGTVQIGRHSGVFGPES